MSYGVLTTKSGQLLVETRRLGEGDRTETDLARFVDRRGRAWSPGRLTLTRLHLSFVPGSGSRGAPMLNVDLAAVEAVEIGEGRVTRVVGVRTATHLLQFRCTGAPSFAQAVATAAEDARRTRRTPMLRASARREA